MPRDGYYKKKKKVKRTNMPPSIKYMTKLLPNPNGQVSTNKNMIMILQVMVCAADTTSN